MFILAFLAFLAIITIIDIISEDKGSQYRVATEETSQLPDPMQEWDQEFQAYCQEKGRAMKVKDLVDECFGGKNRCLYCPNCGSTFSAHKGDYFLLPGDEELTCCDEPLLRGNIRRVFEES